MSMNKNTIQALKLDDGRIVTTDPLESISLIGGNSYTLGVLFWCSHIEGEIPLIRQSGKFELGLQDGKPYLLGLQTNYNSNTAVFQDTWCSVFAVYNSKESKLSFYINGILSDEWENVRASTSTIQMPLIFGDPFQGYLRFVQLYSEVLDHDGIRKAIAGTLEQSAKVHLDFSETKVMNKGDINLSIFDRPEKAKDTALKMEWGGKVLLTNSLCNQLHQVLQSGSFSVIMKIYPQKDAQGNSHLFNSGEINLVPHDGASQYNSVRLSVGFFKETYEDGSSLGDTGCEYMTEIPYDQWLFLAAIYDDNAKKCRCYLNNQFVWEDTVQTKIQNNYPIHFGGRRDGQYTFPGLIEYAAIYDQALNEDQLEQLKTKYPRRDDNGIVSLISFKNDHAVDLVSEELIEIQEPVRLVEILKEPSALCVKENGVATPGDGTVFPQYPEGIIVQARIFAKYFTDNSYCAIYSQGTSNRKLQFGLYKIPNETFARIYYTVGSNTVILTDTCPVLFEKWTNIVIRYRKSMGVLDVFMNNISAIVPDYSVSITGIDISADSVCIGNTPELTKPFYGMIEYVTLSNTDLNNFYSLSESRPSTNTRSLCAFYDFDRNEALERKSGLPMKLAGNANLVPIVPLPSEIVDSYLEVTGDGQVTLQNSPQIQDIIRNNCSLLFRIYPIRNGNDQRNLFSNQKIFDKLTCLGLFADNTSLDYQEIGVIYKNTLYYGGASAKLPYDQWATLILVVDKSSGFFTLYLNGRRYERRDCSGNDICHQKICLLETSKFSSYTGHAEAVCIFNKVLSDSEIAQYSTTLPPLQADGLISYYNFSNGRAIDEKTEQAVLLSGGAVIAGGTTVEPAPDPVTKTTNLVNGLRVQAEGYVDSKENQALCEALKSGSYSLHMQVLVQPPYFSEAVLLSGLDSENNREAIRIAVGGSTADTLKIVVNGSGYTANLTPQDQDAWLDLAFTFEAPQSRLKIFVNGVIKNTYTSVPGNVQVKRILFGNSPDKLHAFSGLLSTVTVMRELYTDNEIEELSNEPPFLLDKGVCAHFDFSGYQPVELVSGTELTVTDSACLELCEDTQPSSSSISPGLGSNPTYGEYMHWVSSLTEETATAVPNAFFAMRNVNFEGGSGGVPNFPSWRGSIINYLLDSIYSERKIRSLLSEYPYVKEASTQNALYAMKNGGKITALSKLFYSSHAYLLQDVWRWLLESESPDLERLSTNLTQKIKNAPEPPKTSFTLSIQSIAFHHNGEASEASVGIRPVQGFEAPLPEWEEGRNSESKPSLAVYAVEAVGSTISIDVSFQYTSTNGTQDSIQLTAKSVGENALLGDAEATLSVKNDGIYSCRVIFNKHSLRKAISGTYLNTIEWTYVCDGVEASIQTYHTLYLIQKLPAKPWSATDPSGYLTLAALKTREEILKYYRQNVGQTADMPTAEQMAVYTTSWINGCKLFRAKKGQEDTYCGLILTGALSFDRDAFDQAVALQASTELSALDSSMIITSSVRLEGYDTIGTAQLSSGLSNFIIKLTGTPFVPMRGENWREDISLQYQEVKALNETVFEIPSQNKHHFVAISSSSDYNSMTEKKVFDAFYTLHGDTTPSISAGLYFSKTDSGFTGPKNPGYYRESLCEEGSCCVLNELENWSFGKKEGSISRTAGEKAAAGLVGLLPACNGIYEPWITDCVEVKSGEVLCQVISNDTIYRILVKSSISLYTKKISSQQYETRLNTLAKSLHTGKPENAGSVDPRITMLEKQIQATIQKTARSLLAQQLEEATGYLSLLAYQMGNVVFNLRSGEPKWEETLNGAYNPVGWVYLQNSNEGFLIVSASDPLKYPILAKAAQYEPFQIAVPQRDGFYLTEMADSVRLQSLTQEGRDWINKDMLWLSMGGFLREPGVEYPFLYMTSNRFALPEKKNIRSISYPVYYRSQENSWSLLW